MDLWYSIPGNVLITIESHGHIYGLWSMEFISVSPASPARNSAYYGILWQMMITRMICTSILFCFGWDFRRLLLFVPILLLVPFIRKIEVTPTTATRTNVCECVLHIKLIFQVSVPILRRPPWANTANFIKIIVGRLRWLVLRYCGGYNRTIIYMAIGYWLQPCNPVSYTHLTLPTILLV